MSIGEGLSRFNEKYASIRLSDNITTDFKAVLIAYINKINEAAQNNEDEEYIKNVTNHFLKNNFYPENDYEINTSNGIDSAIKYNGDIQAIIETKKSSNVAEMPTEDNINRKALWEIIYYFLKLSRNVSSSKLQHYSECEIKRAIITNGLKWFIIDSSEIEKICSGYLERHYYKYKNNKLTYVSDRGRFYEDIENYLNKSDLAKRISYIFFDLTSKDLKKQYLL